MVSLPRSWKSSLSVASFSETAISLETTVRSCPSTPWGRRVNKARIDASGNRLNPSTLIAIIRWSNDEVSV